MPDFGFIGGSYTSWSPNADAARSMNLFPERIESAAATITTAAKYVLYGTPGLTLFCTLPNVPIRGLWQGEGRTFAVGGSRLYELFSGGTYNDRGDVGNDGLPVQFFANGNQLLVVSNGHAWCDSGSGPAVVGFPSVSGTCNTAPYGISGGQVIWVSGSTFDSTFANTNITIAGSSYFVIAVLDSTHLVTLTNPGTQTGVAFTVAVPLLTAAAGAFLDGYFVISRPSSKQLNISAINDGTKWNQLDFAIKEGYPDNIAALLADHEELWIFGTQTTEVWRNTGAATFPLERDPGAFIHMGCVAPFSPTRLISQSGGAGVAWLGGDPRGWTIAYLAVGYQPTRISTHAVEAVWATYTTTADAVSYTYEDQGHQFWVINFPTGNATWVYDGTSGFWHERGWWNGATIDRQRQAFHAFGFGKHLVGDWSSGNIYQMSMSVYTDNGAAIHRFRAAQEPITDLDWIFHSRFRLDAENSGALNPSLDWSIDGGHTFNTPRTTTSQVAGALAVWDFRRLGRSRARVWRITITAAVKVALINAFTRSS